ncbi:sulfate ABC transporter permease subunit [bacterium]|nr:sulfate ABC transporter permease subunit [bacterium]
MFNQKTKQKTASKSFGKYLLIGIVISWFSLLILAPVFGLVRELFSAGLKRFFTEVSTPEALFSFLLTLKVTLIVIVINTIMGILLAITLVKHQFKGKLLLEGLIDLPFAVSPVVAGFMISIMFGPNSWIGSWLENFDIKIVYSIPGITIATLFVTLPFVAREVMPVLKQFGIESEEAAYILGANQWQTFWMITLPSIKWGVLYGFTLTMARAIGEFGAVLVVSGNIINKTQTATLYIHQEFTDFNFAGAYAASLLLALISFIILIVMQSFYKSNEIKL